MTARELLPSQAITIGGERPSRELVEIIQRLTRGLQSASGSAAISPGSMTIVTETTHTFGKRLALTGTQRLAVAGTARARVIN